MSGIWTYKIRPRRTRKDSMMGQCKITGCCMPWAKVLSLQIGLEASWCIWNARRVALWDVLKLAFSSIRSEQKSSQQAESTGSREEVSDCGHSVGDPACDLYCWTNLCLNPSFRQDWSSRCRALLGSKSRFGDEDHQEFLSNAIPNCLPLLESTGVDRNGDLYVYSPFATCPEIVKIPEATVP